jgi:hypothetical protein
MRKPFWFGTIFVAMMTLGLGSPAMAQMLGNGQYGPLPPLPGTVGNGGVSNGGGPGPGTTQNGGFGGGAGMTGTGNTARPYTAPTNNGGYAPSVGNFAPSWGSFGPGPNGYAPSLGNFTPGSGTTTPQ